ncbi:MAG: alpha/beta hydrolase [Gemmataceae bacterium]|nr:alpha/beta hydrolase [Gemmataceae bacterium]
MTPTRRVWLRRVVALLGLAGAGWLASSFAVAYQLTRRPRPVYPEPIPTVAWGTVQPFRLTTADGEDLGAWFVPGRADRPVVLLLHGNGGGRTACLPQAELLAAEGYPILMPTLRAHGDSTGNVNDFGHSARHDVAAAVGWLGANRADRSVVVWGQSLGAAAAVFAAADLGPRVCGYVLECPYRDLHTAVRNRTRHYLPPVVDAVAYAGLWVTAPLVLPNGGKISPLEAASGMPPDLPVLVLAGGADRRALPGEARAIADHLGPRAELVVIEGGDHLALARADPDRYRAAVLGFLERCRGRK